ncbi:MAG: hypothetical protein ACI9P5_003995 [Saprospiraceae bacterium]|jgi:hypothetical protein
MPSKQQQQQQQQQQQLVRVRATTPSTKVIGNP